jgi:hypothetical protein
MLTFKIAETIFFLLAQEFSLSASHKTSIIVDSLEDGQ